MSQAPRRKRVPGRLNVGVYERPDGRFEIGFTDANGRQRWRGPFDTITSARVERAKAVGNAADGRPVAADPRLTFGRAADAWLEYVGGLRPATQDVYGRHLRLHLRPNFGSRRLSAISARDVATYVSRKQAAGLGAWSVKGHLTVLSAVFAYAARHLGFVGMSPVAQLVARERPNVRATGERRVYTPDELVQTLAASAEPWRTLIELADIVGGRESELLGLWWENLDLSDPATATIRFTHQVDRRGVRVPLKTEESMATLPLPRVAAWMLRRHRMRSPYSGPQAFVFATRTGRAISQRDVLRAIYRAQQRARRPDGTPTFPELFEHDVRGHLVVDERGRFVLRKVKRRELGLPTFHALRHGAAMSCEDAEEARDLLRHKNSNVTRAIYRAHFDDRRREQLRARMETRMERARGGSEQSDDDSPERKAS
jgi:integrase